VAIAANPNLSYVKIKKEEDYLILVKDRLSMFFDGCEIVEEFKGEKLKGKEYEPLFDLTKPDKKAYYVVSADFVSTEDGTGLVHIAPAFGEEDMAVGKENNLPTILNVDEEGKFKEEVKTWAGLFVKEADSKIVEELKNRNILFKEEKYEHEYPFCWRCDSPLLYYAKESWFIKTTAVKEDLIKNNEKINWIPDYLKEGRFGEWLKDVKDWNLSRERYWGTPLPVWKCEKCGKVICIGSIKELKEKTISSLPENLHRPYVDDIILKCDCGEKMRRVKEVIDCWFDSGAMPFAQWHYPFENQNLIDNREFFPADFICEGIDQTRGWFYTLLVISTLLGFGTSYKNVISNGIVLDAKGQKMK
jgi:isoleucyl-tRNA synthetase